MQVDMVRHSALIHARKNVQQAGRTAVRQQRQAEEGMRQMLMGQVAAPRRGGDNGAQGEVQAQEWEVGGGVDATQAHISWGLIDELLAQPDRFMNGNRYGFNA